MPKKRGLGAIRINREEVSLDFRYNGERVRGTLSLSVLVGLMRGGQAPESNLVRGATPRTFGDFVESHYLPLVAKPRLKSNARSYAAENDLVSALKKMLGERMLHDIGPRIAEECRTAWLAKGLANTTVKKRLSCLRRIMESAVSMGLIRENSIPPPKGLPAQDRSGIWLRLEEITRLLEVCAPRVRNLVEFLILTGARIGEALDFKEGDVRDGKVWLPTEKTHRPPRESMRALDVESLGPRFKRLLNELKPHPKTGFYFVARGNSGRHISYFTFRQYFIDACAKAGLGHVRIHDLRGSFTMHRAMVVTTFRQLQAELGHSDARSIQSYLDRARRFDPRESVFHVQPGDQKGVP